jgi:hypothetical protein
VDIVYDFVSSALLGGAFDVIVLAGMLVQRAAHRLTSGFTITRCKSHQPSDSRIRSATKRPR